MGRWSCSPTGSPSTARPAGVPAPQPLVPLLVGAALALTGLVREQLPKPATRAAHALVGVVMASYLAPGPLASVAAGAGPLVAVTVLTVAVSVAAAWLLTRTGRTYGSPTATLGLVPGGSAAIIACADDLGADSRQVAFTQYFRVGLIALTAPLVAVLAGGRTAPASPHEDPAVPALTHLVAAPREVAGLLVLWGVCLLGGRLGRTLGLPSPVLLGPMLLTVLVTFTHTAHGFAPAGPLRDGHVRGDRAEVGLRFTRAGCDTWAGDAAAHPDRHGGRLPGAARASRGCWAD